MICSLCDHSFSPEHQSPVCPHLTLDPPTSRPGGPRLRPELQRGIEDAFNLRDRDTLHNIAFQSLNFAARYYARQMLDRIEELDKAEKLRSTQQLEDEFNG